MKGLGARQVSKTYDGVTVLHEASLSIQPGRVHSIVGENGAGKSTLMRILAGVTTPSEGCVTLDDTDVHFHGADVAAEHGVVMVHQELALVPALSISDNIMLARPKGAPWKRRRSKAERQFVRAALSRVGMNIDPNTLVADLSMAQGYLVEIAKALALEAKYIIFDEPTAALPKEASNDLLSRIGALRSAGCGIAYISHRLEEVRAISDDITVMRDGRVVAQRDGSVSEDELIHLMVDRPVGLYRSERPAPRSRVVLRVSRMSSRRVSDVSLKVREGEIVGFAGLVGAGRSETALAIAGADRISSGDVVLDETTLSGKSAADIRAAGIAVVPEDRKHQGIIQGLSVHENLHTGNLRNFLRLGLLNERQLRQASDTAKTVFDIRLRSLLQPIETLSGGNQQKAILARAMETSPKVLILDEPTRGVDIRAKDEIHKTILSMTEAGMAVILISSELEEVLALSHRIYVFAGGRITGELDNTTAVSAEEVMRLATPNLVRNGEMSE